MTLLMTGHDRERKYTTDWHRNSGRKQRAEQKRENGLNTFFFCGGVATNSVYNLWLDNQKKPPSNVYNYVIQVQVTSAMMTAKH